MSARAPGASAPIGRPSACAPAASAPSNSARPVEFARVQCHHIAGAARQALGVFQLPQLGGGVDLDIAVGADPEPPPGGEITRAVENAVAERGLGQRAKPDHRTRCRQRADFLLGRVGRVDDAPACIEAGIVDEPLHRPAAERGDAVLDFSRLLGGMDVNRPLG